MEKKRRNLLIYYFFMWNKSAGLDEDKDVQF